MYIHKGQLHLTYNIFSSKCILISIIVIDSNNQLFYLLIIYYSLLNSKHTVTHRSSTLFAYVQIFPWLLPSLHTLSSNRIHGSAYNCRPENITIVNLSFTIFLFLPPLHYHRSESLFFIRCFTNSYRLLAPGFVVRSPFSSLSLFIYSLFPHYRTAKVKRFTINICSL